MTDFNFSDHGTVCMLMPLSKAARRWVNRHLPQDSLQFGGAIAISHRYADDILNGILEAGLKVEPQ
jgi:hypothetical protein